MSLTTCDSQHDKGYLYLQLPTSEINTKNMLVISQLRKNN